MTPESPAMDKNRPQNAWTLDDGRTIYLLTPERFAKLSDGTKLVCIDGEEVVKGVDKIDQDTRFGHLAFGTLGD